MTFGASARVIASAFALAAFAAALIAGMAAGNSSVRTLSVAIVAMILCYLAGLLLGASGEAAVREHLASVGAPRAGSGGAAGRATSENPQVVHNG